MADTERHEDDPTPGMDVLMVQNPTNGTREIVLKIESCQPGSYQTRLGVVELKEVDLTPKTSAPSRGSAGWGVRYQRAYRNYTTNVGIEGSSGRVTLDIAGLGVIQRNTSRCVEIHRKGIGCQTLDSRTRLWIDLGERIQPEPNPPWSQKPNRWVPVQRI